MAPGRDLLRVQENDLAALLAFTEREAKGQNDTPAPDHLIYLWEWFEEIRNFHRELREPLRPSELQSWALLRGIALEPYEATTLLHMDVITRASLPRKK